MVLMDSLGSIYIRKVSSFCSYVPYELKYFDVKLQFAEFHVLYAGFTPRRTRTKTLFANVFLCSCRVHTAANRTKHSHTIHTLSFVNVCGGVDKTEQTKTFANTAFARVRPGVNPA